MSNISKGKRSPGKMKTMGDHNEFLNRITKSLYYSKLPMTDRLSLPVTEFAAELFSEVKSGCSLERLDVEEASRISRNACVSPCSFVLALLYLERLKDCNPEYLYKVAPSELFLVSLMVASKFLNDDGEDDEVFNMEWAKSGHLTSAEINRLEKEFLDAINWAIYVYDQDFWRRLHELEKDLAYKEARKRGWFSYTELTCLMDTVRLAKAIHALVNISSICLATYAAGVVTLLGSALVASQVPGSLLAPRQPVQPSINTTNAPIDLSQVISEPEDYQTNINLNCNSSCENINVKYHSMTNIQNPGWKDLLTTMMSWLPKYLETNVIIQSEIEVDKLRNPEQFNTNSQSILQDRRALEDMIVEVNWKETLGTNSQYLKNHWGYYANYLGKISLVHRH